MFHNLTRELRLSKFQTFLRMLLWYGLAWGALAIGVNYWWQGFAFIGVLYTLSFAYKMRRDRRYATATYTAPIPFQHKTSPGSNGLKVPEPLNRDS